MTKITTFWYLNGTKWRAQKLQVFQIWLQIDEFTF